MRAETSDFPAHPSAAIPECVFDTVYVVSCLGHLGDAQRLEEVMELVREAGWNLEAVAADEPFADPSVRQRMLEGLALARATTSRNH